jgi:hypothetical protein
MSKRAAERSSPPKFASDRLRCGAAVVRVLSLMFHLYYYGGCLHDFAVRRRDLITFVYALFLFG